MLHNSGAYGPNETPINVGAPVNMSQGTPPMSIGHNLSNLSKIAPPPVPAPSPHYNLPDYPTYSHPPLTMPPQMSPFQNYNPLGYHPSYLGQNSTSVHDMSWQNGMLPMNLNTQGNHAANMLNYPVPFTKSQMDSIASAEYKDQGLNRRNVPLNIPQVPSKAFQNDDRYSLYNVNHDKFNRYNNFHDNIKSQDRPLLDNTRRKSLENTVRLIENILINTSKNKELQRNQETIANKDLHKDLDPSINKDFQQLPDRITKDLQRYQDSITHKDPLQNQDLVINKGSQKYPDHITKDLQRYQDSIMHKDPIKNQDLVVNKDLQRYPDRITKDHQRHQDSNMHKDPLKNQDLVNKDLQRHLDSIIHKNLQNNQHSVINKQLEQYQNPIINKGLQQYPDPVNKDLHQNQDLIQNKDLHKSPDLEAESEDFITIKDLQLNHDPVMTKFDEDIDVDPLEMLHIPAPKVKENRCINETSTITTEKSPKQTVMKEVIGIKDNKTIMNVKNKTTDVVTDDEDDTTQANEQLSESDQDEKPTIPDDIVVKIEIQEPEDPMIIVKVEQMCWTDTEYLNPFPRDVNGMTREDMPNSTIIDSEISVKEAMGAVKSGPPHNTVYECPHCCLLFDHPKRFLVHTKWHSFGLTNDKRMELAKQREHRRKQRSEARVIDRMNSKEVTDPESGNKVFQCKECDKAFSSKGSLKNHKQRSHPTRIRECKICRKTVLGWMALRSHLATHNNEAGFQCPDCPKQFKYAHSLAKHRDCHLEKTLACQKCDKKFGSKSQLSAHQKVHERAQRGATYHCSYCAKTFYEAYNLGVHERTHRNERPFLCEICNTSFGTNSSLQRHIKVSHNASKPYECRTCHRFFVTESIRDRHETRQHGTAGELKFACKHCDCRYLKEKDLKKHAYKAHPKGKRKKKDPSDSESSQ